MGYCYGDKDSEGEPIYVVPTFWRHLRHFGIREAIHFWLERKCIQLISKRKPFPWWGKILSRIEFRLRRKK